jgi:tetratricopeptide (TPR) repeat protein
MPLTAWVLLLAVAFWDQHFSNGERLERAGQHAAAAREFEAALDAAGQLGPADWRLPLTLHNLGAVARQLARYPESESYYRRAIPLWETHHPQRLAELAGTLQNLGSLDMVRGRLADAERNYRRAYELRLGALGPAHPDVGISLHGLAELAAVRRRYDEAETLYRQASAILQTAYGADSLKVADVRHNLGCLYSAVHREAEARSMLELAAEAYEKTVPEHPNLAVILRNLADLDLASGDLAHAGERLQRALRICEKSLPPDHEQTGIIRSDYARLLDRRKRMAMPAAGTRLGQAATCDSSCQSPATSR